MNAETFFDNFSLLSESPNGIQKLREMILQMAVQGKLVPRNSDDEPAEMLLERITTEKKRLVEEKKIRKSKNLPPIEEDEIPYKLPENWKWVQLGEVVQFINGDRGKNYPSSKDKVDSGIPFINAGHLANGEVNFKNMDFITEAKFASLGSGKIERNDLIYCLRGTLGKSAVVKNFDKGAIASSLVLLRAFYGLNSDFLYNYLNSILGKIMIKLHDNGTAQPNLSAGNVKKYLFPLPPLEEQKRIVAKVNQLMELCNQLESMQQIKQESHIHLNNAALNKMLDASSQEEFDKHWRLVCDNFGLLYDNLDNVEKLRQSILQLAVMGKLVEQDDGDEPANKLVGKVEEEKQRLVKEGVIKNNNKSPSIKKSDIPYEIPTNWKWVRLIDLCDIGTGSTPLKSQIEYYQNGTIPWITSSSTSLDFVENTETWITEKAVDECHLRLYPPGTLIIALYGQGKTRGQVAEIQIEATINQACAALIFAGSLVHIKDYVKLVLKKQYAELRSLAAGGAQPNLNVGKIKNALIPLPPLEEQKRIVAKVDQLMELCDSLEAGIRQAQEDGEKLMEVAVSGLLASCD